MQRFLLFQLKTQIQTKIIATSGCYWHIFSITILDRIQCKGIFNLDEAATPVKPYLKTWLDGLARSTTFRRMLDIEEGKPEWLQMTGYKSAHLLNYSHRLLSLEQRSKISGHHSRHQSALIHSTQMQDSKSLSHPNWSHSSQGKRMKCPQLS